MNDQQFKMLLAQLSRIADAVETIARAQDPDFKRPESAILERLRSQKPAEPAKGR